MLITGNIDPMDDLECVPLANTSDLLDILSTVQSQDVPSISIESRDMLSVSLQSQDMVSLDYQESQDMVSLDYQESQDMVSVSLDCQESQDVVSVSLDCQESQDLVSVSLEYQESQVADQSQISDKVMHLLKDRGIAQRTALWLAKRSTLITASEASSALKRTPKACKHYVEMFGLQDTFEYSSKKSCNPYQSTQALIKKKSSVTDASAVVNGDFMAWGTLYEEVARQIYQQMTGETVHEFGLLIHPEHPWIGASPDGITSSGKVVEIKVPSVRAPSSIPPLQYVIQVYFQMEVTGLDNGDFFDVVIIEWTSEEEWLASAMSTPVQPYHTHGIVCQNEQSQDYVYAPEATRSPLAFLEWAHRLKEDGMRLVYYQMVEFELIGIMRDPMWLSSNLEELREVHDEIQSLMQKTTSVTQKRSSTTEDARPVKRHMATKQFPVMTQCLI